MDRNLRYGLLCGCNAVDLFLALICWINAVRCYLLTAMRRIHVSRTPDIAASHVSNVVGRLVMVGWLVCDVHVM